MPTRRSAPSTSTKKYPVKKSAKKTASVSSKVTALARQVKKLNTISYDKVQMQLLPVNNATVTQPYFLYHCNALTSNWTPIFGYDAADVQNANKMYVNSYKVDARLTQNTEADLIWYTMFVLSLKDDGADSTTFDPATGNLNMTDGIHYNRSPVNGKVFINTRFFNIHKYKRFYMGGRANDQSAPVTRDLSFTVVPKQKLVTNPKGNIFNATSGLAFPKDPSKNYYMVLFNDDLGTDLQTNNIVLGGIANIAIPN